MVAFDDVDFPVDAFSAVDARMLELFGARYHGMSFWSGDKHVEINLDYPTQDDLTIIPGEIRYAAITWIELNPDYEVNPIWQ